MKYAILLTCCLLAIVHIWCAVSVFSYSLTYRKKTGRGSELVPTPLWMFLALLFGTLIGTFYWVIHCSAMNPRIVRSTEAQAA